MTADNMMSNTQESNPMVLLLPEGSSSDIDISSTQHDAKRLPTSSPAGQPQQKLLKGDLNTPAPAPNISSYFDINFDISQILTSPEPSKSNGKTNKELDQTYSISGINAVKKLRSNKVGFRSEKEYQKLVSKVFGTLDLFKQNPHLKVSMPNSPGVMPREKVPLYPMVIKSICILNSDLTDLLNQNGIECKYSKQLENRCLKEDTEHKIAYLVKQPDREQLISFGLNFDFSHYKCELPHFLKYNKQCFNCRSFGHTKDSFNMCVK